MTIKLKYYNTATSQWEYFPGQIIMCTSSTRPTGVTKGQHIFETDTNKTLRNISDTATPEWKEVGNAHLETLYWMGVNP